MYVAFRQIRIRRGRNFEPRRARRLSRRNVIFHDGHIFIIIIIIANRGSSAVCADIAGVAPPARLHGGPFCFYDKCSAALSLIAAAICSEDAGLSSACSRRLRSTRRAPNTKDVSDSERGLGPATMSVCFHSLCILYTRQAPVNAIRNFSFTPTHVCGEFCFADTLFEEFSRKIKRKKLRAK